MPQQSQIYNSLILIQIFCPSTFFHTTSIINLSSFAKMESISPSTSWHSLPQEIRTLILEAVLEDGCSVSKFATVSREWQKVIEQQNFARIKLIPSCLTDFSSMVHRNRALVRYIWLCVELEHYSSLEAYTGETRLLSWRDLNLVATTIKALFSALSTWEPNGELLLDISIHSPSDSKYLLKYLTFEPDMPSNSCSDLGNIDLADKAGHDWNAWSAMGTASKPIYKTLNLISLHDPSSYIDDAPDEDSLSDTDDFSSDTDDSWPDTSNYPPYTSNYPPYISHFLSDTSTSSSDDTDDSSSGDTDDSSSGSTDDSSSVNTDDSLSGDADDSSSDINDSSSEIDTSSSDEDTSEEDTLESQWWQQIPSVPAITGLLLRQQTRRQWSPRTLQTMFAHLPRLQEVFYEPWRQVYQSGQVATDKGK